MTDTPTPQYPPIAEEISLSADDDAILDAIWDNLDAPQASASVYPAEVLRYGDAGQRLYDAQVQALTGIGVAEDEARHDVLYHWLTLVTARQLPPITD